MVDDARRTRKTRRTLRDRSEKHQSDMRHTHDLAVGIQNQTAGTIQSHPAVLLFPVLSVRRHVAPLCADGRRHAAGGYQLENPRRETMARSAQHDAAVPDQFIWTGNRRHVRGELGSAVRLAGTLVDT